MTIQEDKEAIRSALVNLGGGPLRDRAMALLDALGYRSDRQGGSYADPAAFHDDFAVPAGYRPDKALEDEWRAIDVLFQLTDDDIRHADQSRLFDSAGVRIDNAIIMSYVFLAVDLRGEAYTRSQLAEATREINKLFGMPAFILYRHGGAVTPAVINRRLHKRDAARDVLEKVTLIKDIRTADPHRAHIEILHDLSLDSLTAGYRISNFVELHQAWQKTLDSSELNKRFFREIADWYFWAVELVVFPDGAGPEATRNPTAVIRLLTRLIFVWFMKEKGLAPDDLFSREKLEGLLRWDDPQDSAYYKAVLQNLFFATLNQAMGPGRVFRKSRADARGHNPQYGIHNVYRYERYFTDPAAALALFARIPFLNGGLFECLDRPAEGVRVDGFSDRADNPLRVPDELFFGREQTADLNDFYGTTGKQYKVRGLIDILNHYKFTIDENTPIEEDVALDPELLGKVLENLLAAYNPETNTTARKATGSFYTPREIVNYMVDEALLAYLEPAIAAGEAAATASRRLPDLLAYSNAPHEFSEDETERLIAAIDSIKILDPACGSGAFPMGILHKLVFVLGKLDPGNARWKERQLAKAAALDDPEIRRRAMEDVEATFARNRLDYARKLYLIENCIYGVDIQPIAVQVAKLRFFISLAVDQPIDDAAPNRGILPLPNLETKFVAANTLLGIARQKDEFSGVAMGLRSGEVVRMEKELKDVRHRYFTARTPDTKNKYRLRDTELRAAIAEGLTQTSLSEAAGAQLANWNPYDQNAAADFFDPEWMFGLKEGFDIVIGNPPYVRQEKIRDLKPALQKLYRCYKGTADLYVYFFEAGYNMLRPGGALVYISSNKYFRAGYGDKLRGLLGGQTTIRRLIDFGDAPVFSAIAYPSIIVLTRDAPNGNRLRAFNWEPGPPVTEFGEVFAREGFAMPQEALGADGWRLEDAASLALLDKLRKAGTPLGEYVSGRFYRGILTGLNEAFVVDRATRDRLIAEDPRSAELLKPFLRGRDVKRWRIDDPGLFLLFITWKTKVEDYPAVHTHLKRYESALAMRPEVIKGRYPWYVLSRYAADYWEEFERPKIVYPDIAQSSEFAYDTGNNYLVNTLYLMPTEAYWLLGLLNSKALFWFYSQISNRIRGGFVRYIAQYVSEIPIATPTDTLPIQTFVNEILSIKKSDPEADVTALEREIDELVYQLYGLTEAEIVLIEAGTGAPPEDPSEAGEFGEDGDEEADQGE